MKQFILAIIILPWILIACDSKSKSTNHLAEVTIEELPKNESANKAKDNTASEAPAVVEDEADFLATTDAKQKETVANNPQLQPETPVNIDWDKKIIKTANVKLEVKSYENYSLKVRNTIKKYGGYIAKEDNFNTEEKAEAVMSIRVPVQFFEPLINELPADDAKQLERNVNTEEVTGQIIDTKARLETRKVTRSKYLEFLKQSNKVEDILKVQSEINDIQEDIESAEGRLSQLSNEARYSTVNLTFYEPKAGYNPNDEPGYGSRVSHAFANGGKWFADLFVGLISIWPLWLFGVLVYFIIKRWRKPSLVTIKK